MKKLIIFMILSSIFSLFASTSTTSTTFEFQAQKKRPSNSGVNDNWKFSINIVDRFHNNGDVLTGLPDIEIAKDSLVTTQDGTLTSNNLHLFDVIYQTNSFYYPMQIDVIITDFIESKNTQNETADVIKVIPDIKGGYSFVEINNTSELGATEEDFNEEYGDIITAKVDDETTENTSNLHKYTLVAQVPFTDRDSFFRKIAIYSEQDTVATAEIKYTFPVSIRLDDPNSLENKSGTYVMTVKVEAKTDL